MSAVLAFYLNSAAARYLQEQIAYGAVQLQLSQDELGELPVPNFPPEAARQIGDGYRKWRDSLDEACDLVTAAKKAIEELVDGTLDEDRVVAESAEIESWLEGNPSPYKSNANK